MAVVPRELRNFLRQFPLSPCALSLQLRMGQGVSSLGEAKLGSPSNPPTESSTDTDDVVVEKRAPVKFEVDTTGWKKKGDDDPYEDNGKATRKMFDKRKLRKDNRAAFEKTIKGWRDAGRKTASKSLVEEANVSGRQSWLKVFVRKRPLFKRETDEEEFDVISVPSALIKDSKTKGKLMANSITVHTCLFEADLRTMFVKHVTFSADAVFDEYVDNSFVYDQAARPMVGQARAAVCWGLARRAHD